MVLQKTQMGYFSCALDGHQCRFRDKAPLSLCQSLCLPNSSRLGAVGAATRKLANRLSNSCMLQVMHWAHSTAVQENLHFSSICRGGGRKKSWTGCPDTELQRFVFQELVCVIRWHIFLHSCHLVLAGFLVPALLPLCFQCSSQTFSKCYDSIFPVKLGSSEKTTVTGIPTKSRKDIISLIIITASALFRSNSLIFKFCWEVTSRNYRCSQ